MATTAEYGEAWQAAYIDRHEQCQATRDEAFDLLLEAESLGMAIANIVRKHHVSRSRQEYAATEMIYALRRFEADFPVEYAIRVACDCLNGEPKRGDPVEPPFGCGPSTTAVDDQDNHEVG